MFIIGDVHGRVEDYKTLLRDTKAEYSVQLGDMGFTYELLHTVDAKHHKFIPGNHDNYDHLPPHALRGYGQCFLGGSLFFFIRGGYSIDYKTRLPGVSWWATEELDYHMLSNCIKMYTKLKPSLVLSHECPSQVFPFLHSHHSLDKPSRTAHAMSEMFQAHRPRLWVFGHHHVSRTVVVQGTYFRCLDELEHMFL